MTRALANHVIDADVIIRDPPPYRDIAVMVVLIGVLFVVDPHDLLSRERGWIADAWICGGSLSVMVAERLFSRAWVQVGPRGVRFGRWWRRAHYDWDVIESFAVGNPDRPEIAYVLVKESDRSPSSSSSTRPVRLPKLFSVRPADLVASLEEKRRIFAGAEEAANP